MLNIFNEVTSKRIVAYYESDENRQPLLLETFFPRVSQKGLTFQMLKGKQGLPVALVASALDTNVLFRDYEGFNVSEGKLPFFKEGLKIQEELLYEIAKHDCIYVSEKVFQTITEVTNPQGILAVIEKENDEDNISYDEDIVVVLDGIQDPGNLGTILRTVDSVRTETNYSFKNNSRCI